jgi:hypothetical protein
MDLLPDAQNDGNTRYYPGTPVKGANSRMQDTPARLKGTDQPQIKQYSVHTPTNYRVQQHNK